MRWGIGLGLLLVLTIAPAAEARTETYYLGTYAAPATRPIGDSELIGGFADFFPFTIAAGSPLVFSSSFGTGFSNLTAISDMDADLVAKGGAVIEPGDAMTRYSPEGFPARDIGFASILLPPGDYSLDVFGTATSVFPGPTAAYSGSVFFDAPAFEVPEPDLSASIPAALALMAAGFGLRGRVKWTALQSPKGRG